MKKNRARAILEDNTGNLTERDFVGRLRTLLGNSRFTTKGFNACLARERKRGKTEKTRFQAGKGSKKKKNTGRVLLDRYF